ncbi:MAG: hypothetical protein BGO01_19895 [Armatimonadetes bacterium 55-13]|nr:hypothetical protein [Armatimonadota bacterium]OJU64376.1 MAG: hypothetical protein BGO01_19895 [Armatimonadetes bacterium 55-13]
MHTDDKVDPLVELGYEQKDIAPKNIFKATMIFFGFAFFAWGIVYAGLHFLGHLNPPEVDVNTVMSSKIPAEPNPILQTNITAKTAIRDLRQHENEVLATSGDSEYAQGFKRIPIEQAIKLSAERKANIGVHMTDDMTGTAKPPVQPQEGGH